MSNMSLTFNFTDNEEASKFFLAIGAALAGIKSAVSSAAAAAVSAAAPFTAADPVTAAAAPAAPSAVVIEAEPARTRRSSKRGGEAVPAAAVDAVDAAVSVPSVAPVAAPVAASVAAPVAGRPANINIEALRAHMTRLLALHNNSPVAAVAILTQFCPAGEKKLSAVPPEKFGDVWDALDAAIAAAQLAG